MPRVLEVEALAEARHNAVELAGESALREDQLELRHGDQRLPDRIAEAAQAIGHLAQNAVDLAPFLFGEADQLVIQVDRFERLDEQRVAAGAGPVDDAVELAALS